MADVFVIGAHRVGDIEIRFKREGVGRWKADLIVNYEAQTTSSPPPCFEPKEEVIEALDQAFEDYLVSDFIEENGSL